MTKKLIFFVALILGLVVLTACNGIGGNLESVSYELDLPGIKSSLVLQYDKDENIQTSKLKSTVTFAKAGVTREVYEEMNESVISEYEDVKGLKRTANISDDEIKETIDMVINEMPQDKLDLFFADATKDGKVLLNEYVNFLEVSGYTKK